jgi:PEP-CTERM motif-containing protein
LIDGKQTGFAGGSGFESIEFTIIANGVEILASTFGSLTLADSFFRDDVLDLGPTNLGPQIQLTVGYTLVADGPGRFGFDFAVGGGAVPEPSTWAMTLIGFAGLGLVSRKKLAGRLVQSEVGAPAERGIGLVARHDVAGIGDVEQPRHPIVDREQGGVGRRIDMGRRRRRGRVRAGARAVEPAIARREALHRRSGEDLALKRLDAADGRRPALKRLARRQT